MNKTIFISMVAGLVLMACKNDPTPAPVPNDDPVNRICEVGPDGEEFCICTTDVEATACP